MFTHANRPRRAARRRFGRRTGTWHNPGVIATLREMPGGVRVFLVYAFAILALIGLTLPVVVNMAVEAPVSGVGVLSALLLAYTIFTITLVLQRKKAAWNLSAGLASLTVPLIPLLLLGAGIPGAAFAAALALILFRGLRQPVTRSWFTEP
jgi:hypothetical protein